MPKRIQVTPERWLPKGEVVVESGRPRPLTVFGGIVGEKSIVKILHRGQNQDNGMFEETDTPSPHRMQIPCDRYHSCGGCPMMHTDPEMQESAHRDRVRAALNENGLHDVELGSYTRTPKLFDFRHVVKLGWGWNQEGDRVKIGAFGRRDRRIVPIPKCNVAAPVLRRVMTSLAHHSLEMGFKPYDPETDRGVMRAAILRASSTTGEVMITLIAGRRPKKLNELAEAVAQANGEVVGIWLHLNDDEGNGLFQPNEEGEIRMKPLSGRDWIEEDLDGIGVRIGPGDFYQTNPGMAGPLFKATLDRLALTRDEAFVDLYSGVGGLTMMASKRCGLAVGVEGVAGAVTRARQSAKRNGVNVEFIAGRVEDELPGLAERLQHPVMAVDPARRGLEPEVLQALIAMRPQRLAYISCGASSLGRDLAAFRDAGATLTKVDLFDMFPHTAHVETMTIVRFDDVTSGRSPRRRRVR